MEQETVNRTEKPSLFGMLWSPGEQLDKIRMNPRIWVALIIVTVIYTIASAITAMTMDVSDLLDTGIPVEDAELVLGFTKITAAISGIIAPVFGILISTVIYLIIVKLAKKGTTFKQLFSMNTYISIIGAIGLFLNAVIRALIGGPQEIYITSLAGLLNSDSPVLATFELFAIWQLIVTAIGLHKVGQLSKGVAWTISIIFFVLSLGFAFISSFLAGVAGM